MITHFDRIQERDGQRYGQTDGRTLHDGIGRACVTSRGKNWDVFCCLSRFELRSCENGNAIT